MNISESQTNFFAGDSECGNQLPMWTRLLLIVIATSGGAHSQVMQHLDLSKSSQCSSTSCGQWFVGGSYLHTETEDGDFLTADNYFGVQFGYTLPGRFELSTYLEVLLPEDSSEDFVYVDSSGALVGVGSETQYPISFNLRLDSQLNKYFGYYFGVGVGAAYIRGELTEVDQTTFALGNTDTSSDAALFGQVFGGFAFRPVEPFSIWAGIRYARFTESETFKDSSGGSGFVADSRGVFMAELGARFRF